MCDRKVIKTAAPARNLTLGVNGRLLLEALDRSEVLFPSLFGQRSPVARSVFSLHRVNLVSQDSNHSRRYTMFSEVQPDLRVLTVASI